MATRHVPADAGKPGRSATLSTNPFLVAVVALRPVRRPGATAFVPRAKRFPILWVQS
jgi:hypothetical protein